MSEHNEATAAPVDPETIARIINRAMLDNPVDGEFSERLKRRMELAKIYADEVISLLAPRVDTQPPRPGDGWRPIESAPKDGTFVLLYSPDSERNPFIGQWIKDNDYPDGGAWWSDCECSGFSIDADPTHFMPLPAPPETGVAE